MKRLLAIMIGVGLAVATSAVAATPAAAVSANGCTYPRVCFYLTFQDAINNRVTASYQDMNLWQRLGARSRGSFMVWNTRNNDGARLRMESGLIRCVWPNDGWTEPYGPDPDTTVVAIQIVDSETC